MATRALSVNFPLNTPTIIIDVELFIPIIADNEEKVVSIKTLSCRSFRKQIF